MRQPWFAFWVGDWRQCPELRLCSLAARGLWAELMCRAHQTEPYGHVLYESFEELAFDFGRPVEEVKAAFEELERRKVFSRITGGITAPCGEIASRRMVRDEQRRLQNEKNGKRGGNPALFVPGNGGRITDRITASGQEPDKAHIHIQSTSLSTEKKARKRATVFDPEKVLGEFPNLNTPEVRSAADAYIEARKAKHGNWTAQSLRLALKKFVAGGPAEAVAGFERATEGPWQTVWPAGDERRNGHAKNGHAGTARAITEHIPDPTPRNTNPPKLGELLANRKRHTTDPVDAATR